MTEPDPETDASVAPAMDTDDFVGTPPSGDAHVDGFVSNDQSNPDSDPDGDPDGDPNSATDTEDEA